MKERQCCLMRTYLDSAGAAHFRIGWLPVEHACVNALVKGTAEWRVVDVWRAVRERIGGSGNEHWEYVPS
jgi:hypothetical protein